MKAFLRNRQILIACSLIILAAGLYTGPGAYAVVPGIALLLMVRGFYTELLLGFFLCLILSDSRNTSLEVFQNVKNIYMLILGLGLFVIPRNGLVYERTLLKFWPFFAIAVFCLLFSDNFINSSQKTLSYLLIIITIPNYIFLAWRKQGTAFIQTLVWWVCSLLIIGFALRFIMPEQVFLEDRYTGILGNPNGLGLFTMLFFLLFRITETNWPDLFNRWDRIIIYALIILSLLSSGSRNSLFAVLLFLSFGYFYRISPVAGFVYFVIIGFTYSFIQVNLIGIVTALGLEDQFRVDTLENASGRTVAWAFGWEWIQENIALGKGIGFTDDLYRRYYNYLSMLGHQGNAHNSYITFWLDTGVFGLAFFLRGLIVSFWRSTRVNKYSMPALYAVMFSAFFESWLTASLNPFTIQLLIIITLLNKDALPEPVSGTGQPILTPEPAVAPVVVSGK
ncbi:MAG: O-antigen ligase family protein [Bacteroidetes bacterium]|nr:O-antigen ligase family protein [Bacteroidota bacterium]